MTTTDPRQQRLSARVPQTLKDKMHRAVRDLQARGANTTEAELVNMLVDEGLTNDPAQLDKRLRHWRGNKL